MHRREKSLWKHRLLKRCVNTTSGNVAKETKEGFVRYRRILANVIVYSHVISIRVNPYKLSPYMQIRFLSCKSCLIRAVCASFSSPVAINNKGHIGNQNCEIAGWQKR